MLELLVAAQELDNNDVKLYLSHTLSSRISPNSARSRGADRSRGTYRGGRRGRRA